MPITKYVPATKCDGYVPHCARTVFLACCAGNVPRTIVIWESLKCLIKYRTHLEYINNSLIMTKL